MSEKNKPVSILDLIQKDKEVLRPLGFAGELFEGQEVKLQLDVLLMLVLGRICKKYGLDGEQVIGIKEAALIMDKIKYGREEVNIHDSSVIRKVVKGTGCFEPTIMTPRGAVNEWRFDTEKIQNYLRIEECKGFSADQGPANAKSNWLTWIGKTRVKARWKLVQKQILLSDGQTRYKPV